jgi:hypothetical protein
MVYEKVGRHGKQATPFIGIGLLILSAAVFLQYPSFVPQLLAR